MKNIFFVFIAVMFVFTNNCFADVRIRAHNQGESVQRLGFIALEDPLSSIDEIDVFIGLPLLTIPADGRISSKFGWRLDPINRVSRFHFGLDFANLRSSLIKSAAFGVVTFAGAGGGCGLSAVVRHKNGLETKYCHLENLAVSNGDKVDDGDIIGMMGNTGRSTGPHLHFEARIFGVPVDPAELLMF